MAKKFDRINKIFDALEIETRAFPDPMSQQIIRDFGKNPFLILISCLLSLRARDVITYPVSCKLFSVVQTPEQLLALPMHTLQTLIKPIGFYQRKARILKEVCHELIQRFGGAVPRTKEELLSINHVGPKTTNLMLSLAFDIPAICVDTHVFRLSHHLGLSQGKTPLAVEHDLEKIAPVSRWVDCNYLLVKWGQNVCKTNTKRCVCWQVLEKYGLKPN